MAGISNITGSGTGNPNETLINTIGASVNVAYIYTVAANNCTNSTTYTVVATVYSNPILSSSLTPSAICSDAVFNYTPTSATVGATFTWARAIVTGISNAAGSGINNPSEALTNTSTAPINVTYVFTTTSNGCNNNQNVILTVNPNPTLNSSLSPTVCSGALFNYTPTSATPGAAFGWTRAIVSGISNAAGSGTDNPNEILTNTTTSQIIVPYIYTVSANNCTNPAAYTVGVRVNPVPALSSSLTPPPICSGTAFYYSATSATTGFTFSWTRAAVTGISNPPSSGIGDPIETLTNSTTSPVSVTYVYTLSANGCTNPTNYNVVVTINPIPTLSSTLTPPALCSGTAFSYTPASATTGASFAWTRAEVIGISNTSGSGIGDPNETLINTTTNPLNVVYIYTVSANGCTNASTYNVVVRVNQQPTLTSVLTPPIICSDSVFNYLPASAVTGAVFNWTRAAVPGISNAPGVGTGNPSETLTNTTIGTLNVTYLYAVSVNGCTNPATYSVVVPVKICACPHSLSSSLTPPAICSNTLFSYIPTSSSSGASFTWTRAAVPGISNVATSGTFNPNETLINTTADSINVTYVYRVTVGCTNPIPFNVVVAVKPIPALTSALTPLQICSGYSFHYTPTSGTAGASFSWTRAAVGGITNISGSGTGAILLIPVTAALVQENVAPGVVLVGA